MTEPTAPRPPRAAIRGTAVPAAAPAPAESPELYHVNGTLVRCFLHAKDAAHE